MLKNTALSIAVAFLLVACSSSMHDVQTARASGEGTTQVYAVPPAQAFELARVVLQQQGAESIEPHPEAGYILASFGATFGVTQGAYVGVWVEAAPPAPYSRVTVVTKRKARLDAGTGLTETTFHRELARAVATPPAAGVYTPAAAVR